MKNKSIVSMFCLLLAAKAAAMDVIDPTGLNYVNISDNSSYDGSYTSANLFNYNVSGVLTDAFIQDGTEYARNGAGNCFLAFQLDKNYTNVSSVFYAQRNGANAALDKVSSISVWASQSTAFTAADPGTAPDATTGALGTEGAIWKEYALNKAVNGQYFLLKLTSTGGGNPGGRELRLGGDLGLAPTLVQAPGDQTLYVGLTAHFSVQAGGVGLVYQWSKNGTPLSNGGRISGANTADLAISGLVAGDAGNYACLVSNGSGSFSTAANLTVTSLPSNAAALAVLSNAPAAYWRLNESAGATVAADYAGGKNGSYGTSSGVGIEGPQTPAFKGFPSGNTAVQTINFDSKSAVALPPLNLVGTNGVTITAWVKSDGNQAGYSGIVFGRNTVGMASGLICSADGNKLGYQWSGSGYDFNSGLDLPVNEWCMVALVYSADKVVLYRSSGDTITSATDNSARPVQKFDCTTYLGWDTDNPANDFRTFQGGIDDVAFFDHALSETQINAIFAAGRGSVQLIPIEITSQPTTNQSVFLGSPYSLSVLTTGSTPSYQWFQNNAPIAGATNAIFSVTNASSANLGQYYVVITNSISKVTSSVFNARAAEVLSPTGNIYTNISDDSHYNEGYVVANMFERDMTDVLLDTFLQNDPEFARQGDGSCFFAFELGQVYTNIGSILYAPRFGSPDQVSQMSIWTSKTQAFTAGDPGTAPETVVPIVINAGARWKGYSLNSTLSGRYFLVKMDQSPNSSNGNPGGREFRLGVFTAAEVVPVQITSQPTTNQSVFLGSPFSLTVVVTGTTPSYQWFQNNAAIAGATNKTFSVTKASTATIGQYYVVVSNSANTVTSSVFTVRSASMISPTGALYSNIRDDSHYNESYTAANMFEHDMTGVAVGTFLETDTLDFARPGDGASFVAFDLDQVYANIGSVLFAARSGSQDQIYRMSIWTSETQSFAAADPGTAPQTVVPISSNAGGYWNQYSMTNTLTGRYFLIKMEQAPGSIGHSGNPGGREFRLGLFSTVTPANVVWSKTAAGMVLNWTGGTLMQADTVTGPWVPATGITSGVPIPTHTGTRFYRIQY